MQDGPLFQRTRIPPKVVIGVCDFTDKVPVEVSRTWSLHETVLGLLQKQVSTNNVEHTGIKTRKHSKRFDVVVEQT